MNKKFQKQPERVQQYPVNSVISEKIIKPPTIVNKLAKNNTTSKMADEKAAMSTKRKSADTGNINLVNKIQRGQIQKQRNITREMLDVEYRKIMSKTQNDNAKYRPNQTEVKGQQL